MAYDAADYDLAGAFEAIEHELIDSMMRNMKKHQEWETEEGFQWAQWQAEQLRDLERYRRQNGIRFNDSFARLNQMISDAIRQARATGQADQEVAILEAIQAGFLKGRQPDAEIAGQFFKQNDRKMDALIKATTQDMQRAEYAILRRANDEYRKIVFNAVAIANTGTFSYEQCIDMATKDMRRAGLLCVEYKNGARHSLEDYADMVVKTTTKRAYLTGEGEMRKEWGISTVIVNKRATACPRCLPWTGKVFIDDVWSGGSASDGEYPLISQAMEAGLYHPRCKDSHTTYFPGISTADDKWTRKELEQLEKANKLEARQQEAERQAKSHERQAEFALDPEEKRIQENWAEKKAEEAEQLQAELAKVVEGYEEEMIPRQSMDLSERRKQRLAARRSSAGTEPIPPRIDFAAMSRNELESYIQENLQTEFVGLKGANTDYIREAAKVMSEFESKFGGTIEGLKVQFGGTPNGVYAKYDDKTKTLLLKKSGSIKKFEESQRKANAMYRAKWHKDKDYYATDTYSGTIWHELGHAVDIESGQDYSRRLSATSALDEASVRVSSYAGSTQNIRVTKRSEAWAENFAAYMDGGHNKKKVPEDIKNMIEGISYEPKGIKEQNKEKMARTDKGYLPKGVDDDRILGEKITQDELSDIIEKAKDLGITIGDQSNPYGGFETYRGDPKILLDQFDQLKIAMDRSKKLKIFPKQPKRIILEYGNVLNYDGDKNAIDIHAFAETNGNTITLNKYMYDSAQRMKDEYDDAIGDFFPSGTSIKNILVHEYGHVLQNNNRNSKKRVTAVLNYLADHDNINIDKYIKQNISVYATSIDDKNEYPELIPEILNLWMGSLPLFAETVLKRWMI